MIFRSPYDREFEREQEIEHEVYQRGANNILDKIRAEIEALSKTYPFINHIDTYVKEDDVKKIIDKYRNEVSK